MATTEKPSRARDRPKLAVVVVLPTPPLPEVMTTTRGVEPASSGFRFHWRTDCVVVEVDFVFLERGLVGFVRVLVLKKGLKRDT